MSIQPVTEHNIFTFLAKREDGSRFVVDERAHTLYFNSTGTKLASTRDDLATVTHALYIKIKESLTRQPSIDLLTEAHHGIKNMIFSVLRQGSYCCSLYMPKKTVETGRSLVFLQSLIATEIATRFLGKRAELYTKAETANSKAQEAFIQALHIQSDLISQSCGESIPIWKVEKKGRKECYLVPFHRGDMKGTVGKIPSRVVELITKIDTVVTKNSQFFDMKFANELNRKKQLAFLAFRVKHGISVGEMNIKLNELEEAHKKKKIDFLKKLPAVAHIPINIGALSLDYSTGLDERVLNQAHWEGKSIVALEEGVEQIVASINQDLEKRIKEVQENKSELKFPYSDLDDTSEALCQELDALLTNSEKSLTNLMNRDRISDGIQEQNNNFANSIDRLLSGAERKSLLTVLEYPHFFGPHNIREYLKEKGYTITAMNK